MTTLRSALVLAGTALATALTVAAASPAAASSSVRVAYGDLDLGSAAGRAMLDQRLRRAAGDVCDNVAVEGLAMAAACRREALVEARATASDIAGPAVLG